MENWEPSALAEAIAGRIFVELEASGRHVHVTAQPSPDAEAAAVPAGAVSVE